LFAKIPISLTVLASYDRFGNGLMIHNFTPGYNLFNIY
jgi:hypothetical protein